MPREETRKKATKSSRHKPYQMTDVEKNNQEVFLSTGRTGRRNAMADILDEKYAGVSTASLPNNLAALNCDDDEKGTSEDCNDGATTSKSSPNSISTEKNTKESNSSDDNSKTCLKKKTDKTSDTAMDKITS